jgi:uncharacterized protein
VTESAISRAGMAERRSTPLTAVARRESALFLFATGAIAIHVLDDNFLQPRSGTSARDHLISGLVPLAALALAAAAYPHFRPGFRAAIALTLGVLGIVGGAGEAGYYTIKVGPSGDDYTGLLMILAGFLLVALGALTLWMTRRLDESRHRRYLRRFLVCVAAAVGAFELVLPIAASYVLTHVGRPPAQAADLGPTAEEVTFRTSDGIKLAGTYIPSQNGAAVIAFPGRTGPQEHAKMLARHGYGVLLFDRRGDGASEGDPYRWAANEDVKAAIAYLQSRRDVDPDRIGGLGLSLGGELMLETAGQTDALKAVVSEGAGIRTIREHLHLHGPAMWARVPFYTVWTGATAVFSNHAPPADLKEIAARIAPRPLFLIYATHGLGGEELNPQLYAAAGEPKTLWEISDAGHTGGLEAHPQQYEQRVVAFFDDALLHDR